MAVIETARHLAGLPNASSAEFGDTDAAVISYMNSWEGTEGRFTAKPTAIWAAPCAWALTPAS